jgi:hypothetical protein
MLTDLEQAIKNLRASALRYDKPERYYRGDHDLAFATAKFENAFGSLFREFALNLCPAICDAVRDKLKVTGFSIAETGRNATVRERAGLNSDTAASMKEDGLYHTNSNSAFRNRHDLGRKQSRPQR